MYVACKSMLAFLGGVLGDCSIVYINVGINPTFYIDVGKCPTYSFVKVIIGFDLVLKAIIGQSFF